MGWLRSSASPPRWSKDMLSETHSTNDAGDVRPARPHRSGWSPRHTPPQAKGRKSSAGSLMVEIGSMPSMMEQPTHSIKTRHKKDHVPLKPNQSSLKIETVANSFEQESKHTALDTDIQILIFASRSPKTLQTELVVTPPLIKCLSDLGHGPWKLRAPATEESDGTEELFV